MARMNKHAWIFHTKTGLRKCLGMDEHASKIGNKGIMQN